MTVSSLDMHLFLWGHGGDGGRSRVYLQLNGLSHVSEDNNAYSQANSNFHSKLIGRFYTTRG